MTIASETAIEMYRKLRLIRRFEEGGIELVNGGGRHSDRRRAAFAARIRGCCKDGHAAGGTGREVIDV